MIRNTDAIRCQFSACRRYRYIWELVWEPADAPCAFIGLNPSTADEHGPDPTVRRCIGYARDWGYGRLIMLNAFGYRETDRLAMKRIENPVAPLADPRANDRAIRRTVARVVAAGGMVVAAWGADGAHQGRSAALRRLLGAYPLHVLTQTASGEPGHPLYLRKTLRPCLWHHSGKISGAIPCQR